LKVPARQPKRGRLWVNDGSCVLLRPERPNHVCAYDFLVDRTHEGRVLRMLTIIDEFTKESLMIRVGRKINSNEVIHALADLFLTRGIREFIRSDCPSACNIDPDRRSRRTHVAEGISF